MIFSLVIVPNQLRFDGSAGDLTFSSGSGQEQVEISANKIEFGDNFKLVYDSGGSPAEHQLIHGGRRCFRQVYQTITVKQVLLRPENF
jgi:hypothetical protein